MEGRPSSAIHHRSECRARRRNVIQSGRSRYHPVECQYLIERELRTGVLERSVGRHQDFVRRMRNGRRQDCGERMRLAESVPTPVAAKEQVE